MWVHGSDWARVMQREPLQKTAETLQKKASRASAATAQGQRQAAAHLPALQGMDNSAAAHSAQLARTTGVRGQGMRLPAPVLGLHRQHGRSPRKERVRVPACRRVVAHQQAMQE